MSTSYAEPSDLDMYLEEFVADYYGPDSVGTNRCRSEMQKHFNHINEFIRGVETIDTVPVGTQSTGVYPESLIEWQCRRHIYTTLIARHGLEWGDNVPEWVNGFRFSYERIAESIVDGDLIFTDQVSHTSIGLKKPTIQSQSGIATFFNSYNVETLQYVGSDYQRTYRVVIDGTSSGNNVGKSTFKWSKDNGVSYEKTGLNTGTSWIPLEDGIHVRWRPDSGTGNQTELNDEWYFDAIPSNISSVAGENVVKVGHYTRG